MHRLPLCIHTRYCAHNRVRFMLDMIMDLKNNKKRQGQAQAQERGLRLKRWLGTVKSAQGGLAHDTTLRVSWSDLTGDVAMMLYCVGCTMLQCA
jgi:hypothetical protein